MKKLLIAAASAVAVGFSAFAADWFDADIGNYYVWPTNTIAGQGTWSNTDDTELAGEAPAAYLEVDAESSDPLTFTALTSQTVGSLKKNVEVSSSITFTPFRETELPEIDDEAKAGVIVVTNTATGGALKFYVLAKDTAADPATNTWVATEITATTDATAVKVKVNNNQTATYTFGSASTNIAIVAADESEISSAHYTGSGYVASLASTYEMNEVRITNVTLNAHATYIVSNNNELVTLPTNVIYGTDVTVVYTTVGGYLFADGKTTRSFTKTANFDNVTDGILNTGLQESDIVEAEAEIGSVFYLTLNDAFGAAQDDDVIIVHKTCTISNNTEIAKNVTLDLNSCNVTASVLTVVADKTVAVADNAATPAGALVLKGAVAVNGTLDLSAMPFGATPGCVLNGGSFTIADGATAVFAGSATPNWTFGNTPAFFTGSAIPNGGIVQIGSKTWTGNSSLGRFVLAGEVATADMTGTYDPVQDPATFNYVESFATVGEAIASVKAGGTLTLTADAYAQDATCDKAFTFDLNGHQFTISEETNLTVNAVITFQNSVEGEGGFLNDGIIEANADINLSAFTWGAGGFISSSKKTANFQIAAGKTVNFGASSDLTQMLAFNPNFFDGSEETAKVTTSKTYALTNGRWLSSDDCYFKLGDQQVASYSSLDFTGLSGEVIVEVHGALEISSGFSAWNGGNAAVTSVILEGAASGRQDVLGVNGGFYMGTGGFDLTIRNVKIGKPDGAQWGTHGGTIDDTFTFDDCLVVNAFQHDSTILFSVVYKDCTIDTRETAKTGGNSCFIASGCKCRAVKFLNNIFAGGYGDTINLRNPATETEYIISNNVIYCSSESGVRAGVALKAQKNVIIYGNTFYAPKDDDDNYIECVAIGIDSGITTTFPVTVYGNTFKSGVAYAFGRRALVGTGLNPVFYLGANTFESGVSYETGRYRNAIPADSPNGIDWDTQNKLPALNYAGWDASTPVIPTAGGDPVADVSSLEDGATFYLRPGTTAESVGAENRIISTTDAWTISYLVRDAKAKIGTALYLTFQEAVQALSADNQTVTLLVNDAVTVAISNEYNATFDLGGKTLTDNGQKLITCSSGKTLNLTNGTIACNQGGYGIEVWGTLNILSGTYITEAGSGGMLDLYNGSVVNVYDGADLYSQHQQVFRCKDDNSTATINIYGGNFRSAMANTPPLAEVYKSGSTANITISGGTFQGGNYLFRTGNSDGTINSIMNLTITGGQFTSGYAPIYCCPGATMNCTLGSACKAKFSNKDGLQQYCADGYRVSKVSSDATPYAIRKRAGFAVMLQPAAE